MATATKKRKRRKSSTLRQIQALIFVALLLVLAFFTYRNFTVREQDAPDSDTPPDDVWETVIPDAEESAPPETPEPEPEPLVLPEFRPYAVSDTEPSKWLSQTEIMVNDVIVDSYAPHGGDIDFGLGSQYTEAEGIVTFRGNNFRNTAAYGFASLEYGRFAESWKVSTGALTAPNGVAWTGNGWTGQPLVVRWPKDTRAVMNMYGWAKEREELIEVVYAAMDGNVYFMELETGEKTRDTLNIGYTFKGAGAIDPRGYPILYVGAGYDSAKGSSRVFVISLIDGQIMYEFGNSDSFSLRGRLSYFDSSPLVCAETDQLIYPGENGILYIIKLNTSYDESAGTLSIDPSDVVKWRYYGTRTTDTTYWPGMESSAVIWREHIIMADNGGNLICLNLNTLETDWVQDVLDDTNCSPVLELEDGHPYIYISTSFHGGWRAPSSSTAVIPVWKIDAVTGEIIWQTDYNCCTVTDVSGGVQGTLALGKYGLSGLIFVPVSMTPSGSEGKLVALDKQTGEEVWSFDTKMYAWSSPVAFYDTDGRGYIIYCTSGGFMYLLDGLTGEALDSRDLGSNIEASACVFDNVVVIGTRTTGIYGVTLE